VPDRFPIICGPTAGGKSALAVALALALREHGRPAEVVTADAFQVYRGMDIGTAKPTADERRGVPHHLIDLVEPTDPFTVEQWLSAAEATIDGLRARGVIPIVVGGTHLYVKALLEGLFQGPPPDPALRQRLAALDPATRRAELERADPAAAARIHFNDERRTIRALEVFRQTGRPISDWQKQWDDGPPRTDALLVVLDWPTEAINRRINARVKAMMSAGLLGEVEGLWRADRLGRQAREALGYKQLLGLLEAPRPNPAALEGAVERIKIETRRFAKNQRTWLKRLRTTPGTVTLTCDDAANPTAQAAILLPNLSP
jgi:tRNA dimethylallyltransferase